MTGPHDPQPGENLRRWQQSGAPRLWVESRGGKWGHADWLSLLAELRASPHWPLDPDAVGRTLEEARRRWENLRRWEQSGEARRWVEWRQGRWGHEDWLALLGVLEHSGFWPLDPDAVGLTLEEARRRWEN